MSNLNAEIKNLCCQEHWDILTHVYKMLFDSNVLNTPGTVPILDFKFPEEIMKIIDFKIPNVSNASPHDIRIICETVIKYSLKTSHPQFHNQLFGGVNPYGLAASWITDALNTSQYTFEVAPVFTLMENEVIKTFCKLFGFKDGDGIFAPGGSISNMYGMVLAKYKRFPDIKSTGSFGVKPLVAFTSSDSHYSIQKAVHWLGIGTDNLIMVDTDQNGCISVDNLIKNIDDVIRSNRQPFFVNATAGTTVLGAFDNLNAIAEVCEKYNLWMHVDCCLGGSVIFSGKYKYLLNGVDRADSISWNPHKSLGVPLQCSMFLTKENGLLHKCNSANATYLFQQDKFYDITYDTGDKSIQCGRKVDVFKFWLMLKAHGISGFEVLIDNVIDNSKYLEQKIRKHSSFRSVLENFQYTNVCFWYIPKSLRMKSENDAWWDELYKITAVMKTRMIQEGSIMVSYVPLPSKNIGNFFRMSLACFPPPTKDSIDFFLSEIERLGDQF